MSSAVVTNAPGKGFLSDSGIRRGLAFGAVLILSLALQSTLLVKATLLGVIPQLTLIVVVSFAFLDGERVGTVAGFAAGLLQDLLLPQSIIGLTALVYTLIGYSVGSLRVLAPQSVWAPVLFAAGASAAAESAYALLSIMLGQQWVSIAFTLRVIGLVALYSTLLMPLVFPALRRLADRYRPERIYRW